LVTEPSGASFPISYLNQPTNYSIHMTHSLQLLPRLAITLCFSAITAQAATYQWNGSASSDWATSGNWNPTNATAGITAGPAVTGISGAHRLNVNNAANNPLIYDALLGNTTYANTSTGARGLVIGSGTSGAGRMIITGGTFSTVGSTGQDVLGNVGATAAAPAVSSLVINGGNFVGSALGLGVCFGGSNNIADITVQQGSATFATLTLGIAATGSATLNLQGGVTSVNNINRSGAAPGSVKFAGGSLRARVATTTFMQGLTAASLSSTGGTIDTAGFDVTMNQPLVDDAASPGGNFTKAGLGTLTAPGAHTYTGGTTVSAGRLSVTAPLSSNAVTVAAGATLRVRRGTTSWAPATADLSGIVDLDLGVYAAANPVPLAPTSLTLNAPVTLNIAGGNLPVGVITLLTYGTKTGTGSFTLGTLPPGAAGTLVDTGTAIELQLTSPSVQDLTWSTVGASWQTNGGMVWNTNTATYLEYGGTVGDLVNFTDAAVGIVEVPGAVRPISVTITNTTPYTFRGAGGITGATTLIKNGTGIATFTTADSYTGPVTVNAGAVLMAAANTTTGAITVATNATFGLKGIIDGAGQTLTFTGPGVTTANTFFTGSAIQRGALQGVTGTSEWQGNVVFSGGNARVGVQDGASLIISGNITESAPSTILNVRAGTVGSNVTLSGTGNAWTGSTDVYSGGGSIIAGAANVLPATSQLRVGATGLTGTSTFDLNGFNQICSGLSTVGGTLSVVTNTAATPATLTLRPVFSAASFPGIITNGAAALSIVKQGSSTQTFTGANTYTGNTTISEGTLALSVASLADTADVIIAAAGTLALNFTGTDTVDELTIAGVGKAPGIWGSAASGAPNVDAQLTGTGTGTLTVTTGPVGDAYTAWAALAGLTGNDALSTADPDGDAVQNLLEFVLGSSPTAASTSALPTSVSVPNSLALSFSRADAAESLVTLTIQVSDDLQSWPPITEFTVPAASDLTGTLPVGATVIVTENGTAPDIVEVRIPQAAANKRFIRVKAVKT
jgi:autotransporter-associated beta strand protein